MFVRRNEFKFSVCTILPLEIQPMKIIKNDGFRFSSPIQFRAIYAVDQVNTNSNKFRTLKFLKQFLCMCVFNKVYTVCAQNIKICTSN